MPATSTAQRKAMYAAAEGKSTLGIPKAVGEEFVAEDATGGMAAGTVYVAPDGDILLLRRSKNEMNYAGHWALPGGKAEEGETPEQTAYREAREEMKIIPECAYPPKLIDSRVTPNKMAFHTFAQLVPNKFSPDLNEEHSGFAWVPLDQLPQPMHPAVMSTLTDRLGMGEDMDLEEWEDLRNGFLKWLTEEEAEPEHAVDSIAMDRDSVRRVDADGHMHVERTRISKSNVCPYYGREIPDFKRLGLDPDRIYNLYRDPDELAKAAPTFARKPLMIIHKPTEADDHPRETVIGTIGDEVQFDAPYLTAPLTVWDGEGIDMIKSGERKELSSGYRYRADMTPGTVNGERYDGVMRDIEGNHVSIVSKGRAGSDVVVGDEALKQKEPDMANAQMKAKKAKLTEALKGKLAQDANIDDVVRLLMAADEDLPKNKADDEDDPAMDEEDDKDKKAEDADEDDADKKKAEDEDDEDDKEEMVSKKAMDAAINAAVKSASRDAEQRTMKRLHAIRAAEDDVAPYVGKLAMAHDSAESVYRTALGALNVDVAGVNEVAALKVILKSQPLPGSTSATPKVAMDAAKVSSFFERFPEAKTHRVKTI